VLRNATLVSRWLSLVEPAGASRSTFFRPPFSPPPAYFFLACPVTVPFQLFLFPVFKILKDFLFRSSAISQPPPPLLFPPFHSLPVHRFHLPHSVWGFPKWSFPILSDAFPCPAPTRLIFYHLLFVLTPFTKTPGPRRLLLWRTAPPRYLGLKSSPAPTPPWPEKKLQNPSQCPGPA